MARRVNKKPRILNTHDKEVEKYLNRMRYESMPGQTSRTHYRANRDKLTGNCAICAIEGTSLHRHRIIPGGQYIDENIVIVCALCHKLIHRILDELGDKDYALNCRLAIEFAKGEVRCKDE